MVEVRTDTGYWTAILQNKCAHQNLKIYIQPHDLVPTAHDAATSNDYHGNVPSYTPIYPGDASTIASTPPNTTALMVCYPPPDDMAYKALRAFSGNFVFSHWEIGGFDRHNSIQAITRNPVCDTRANVADTMGYGCSAYLSIWKCNTNHSIPTEIEIANAGCVTIVRFNGAGTLDVSLTAVHRALNAMQVSTPRTYLCTWCLLRWKCGWITRLISCL